MYHSRFFFYQLALRLQPLLRGARLMEAYSQQKDELIMHFLLPEGSSFFVRADLSQGSSILSFPKETGRSRSNTANLFPEISGSVVEDVEPEMNDRYFRIRFSNGSWLCFKMFGQRSNILLHDRDKVISIFNNHLKKDLDNIPVPAGKGPEDLCWHPNPEELHRRCPGFTRRMWQYWDYISSNASAEVCAEKFRSMVSVLLHPEKLYICREKDEVFVSFFPMGEVLLESSDPLEISGRYHQLFWQVNRFHAEKEKALRQLNEEMVNLHQQTQLLESKALQSEHQYNYRLQADLLMAYGHSLPEGLEKVSLPAFDGSAEIEIKLKKDLSISANAERLYRKARGQRDDLLRIENSLRSMREKLIEIQAAIQLVSKSSGLRELQKLQSKDSGTSANPGQESQPFHQHLFMNYEIRVGKNARANDELLRISHKDDWWLHARDVPGSHVVVRIKKGSSTPAPVLQRAAELAAFHSKAGKEGLVPVMLTERKYVRKVKGAAPGQVKVEREKTLLVSPKS